MLRRSLPKPVRRGLEALLLLLALGSFALSAIWGGGLVPAFPERFLASSLEVSAKNECFESFRLLINEQRGNISSHDYLKFNLSHGYSRTRHDWYRGEVALSAVRNLKERINLYKYFDEGLAPNEKIVWIQQGLLKELNEKFWDIGGTEYYLLKLDDALADVLEANPSWGRIIHKNYKDRVLITSLSSEDIQSKLLKEVQSRVAKSIGEIREKPSMNYSWEAFIRQSIRFSEGKDIETAFTDLMLRQFRMTFEEWKSTTVALRDRLKFNLENQGVAWPQLLRAARRYKDSDDELTQYLLRKGVRASRRSIQQVRYYMKLMRLADFLPIPAVPSEGDLRFMEAAIRRLDLGEENILEDIPRLKHLLKDTWGYRRAVFLDDVKNSSSIMATDISGLGERAMLAQDNWVGTGARLDRLENVYEHTTEFLNSKYRGVEDELKQILGADAHVYVYASGDDALWGLPKMTDAQMAQVKDLLKTKKDLYSYVNPVQEGGGPYAVADAVFRAREELFRLKPEMKPDLDAVE